MTGELSYIVGLTAANLPMHAEVVREWVVRQPFEAFEVWLSTGETHQVRDSVNVAVAKTKLIVADPKTDRVTHIDLEQIDRIQALQTA